MTQEMPDMCPAPTGRGQPGVLYKSTRHERKSASAVLGRYFVARPVRSGKENTHVVVNEDEVVLGAPHLEHDVVHANISVQDVRFISQVM